jgi:hypothetical protein
MNNYVHIGFTKSLTKNKKYDAILKNKKTGQIKIVPFGQLPYEHYKDTTGLNLYSHLNHLDEKRKKNYYSRHGKQADKYSAKWFSHRYLWS